ncbi:DsbA family protein [Hyphococcus sp.]|uniref:DsbA family protein n=1 Tax=Hyphococcus sp. TaxID=2038636 RepID=UPI00208CC0D8|nr:MAG: disulfide bond formation protein DsbD [Marinicaulis sp.]
MSVTPISPLRQIAAGAVAAMLLAACGGANSETAATPATGESVEKAGEGALSDMAVGSVDAPITVVEYASVTCPHCATFHQEVYPTIKENYINTGKVRFIFREFPTAPANLSVAGSMLARCAADKGGNDAYFVVLNALFATQRTWIYGESPRDELLKIAAQAGMGADEFDACVKRQELLDYLNENIKEGSEKYGIASTPSFVLNGQVRHFSSVEDFSKALDEALEKVDAGAGE